MKSKDLTLERIIAEARQAPPGDLDLPELPYGFATRVLSQVTESRRDWVAHAERVLQWGMAGSLTVVTLMAAVSFLSPRPTPSSMVESAVEHQFANLVLNR